MKDVLITSAIISAVYTFAAVVAAHTMAPHILATFHVFH